MILPVHDALRARLATLLRERYDLPPSDQPTLAIGYAPTRALGDLALPVAFELARRLRKAPRVIAQELAGALTDVEGVARLESTANGYLNVFLDRAAFLRSRLDPGTPAARPAVDAGKTIVEHTAINPNKAAHIGHLRNSALGDTLVRVLRFRGVPVEVQNYIDDTGVQVADVVVGFEVLERTALDERPRAGRAATVRLLLLGSVRAGHRVVPGRQGAARRAAARAASDRAGRQPHRRDGSIRRRRHRPPSPGDDASARHRVRPADVGRRHPPSAVLGACLRHPEETRHDLPADRGTSQGLLGDADRRCRSG